MGLVSGTAYAFGGYERDLKFAIALSQTEVQALGIVIDVAMGGTQMLSGWIVDNFSSCVGAGVASLLVGAGYMTVALALTLALTLVILIFAEITPKTIAALHPERVAFPASALLLPLQKLLMPLVLAINSLTNGILKLMGFSPDEAGDDAVSQEELPTIVTESASMIPSRHRRMLVNILDLEQMTVNDIMAPRNEIYGIDMEAPDEAILQQLKNSEHTRLHRDVNFEIRSKK